jgi:GDP-mannose 6-dehydrogenase
MRISVFGLGYVGTVCAACLANRGHDVVGVDDAKVKVDLICSGKSPIIECDIPQLIKKTVNSGNLSATMDAAAAIRSTDISLVCVGTPSQPDGDLSLTALKAVVTEIGHCIRSKTTRHSVVIRSTVLPGTTRRIIAPLLVSTSEKTVGSGFGVAFNPEFMREGSSVADFNVPSKTVVGALDEATATLVLSLYDDLPGAKISTNTETAELVKYVDNAWHALKVSFANEIGMLANALEISSAEVMSIFFEDKRLNISAAYLQPGFAFGGSCLPKDLRTLTHLSRKLNLSLPVLNHVLHTNHVLIERGFDWILKHSTKRIVFLGISFKSGTDDVRESPFVELVKRLLNRGYDVRVFDSKVNTARIVGSNRDYLMQVLPHFEELVVPNIADAINGAETIVLTSPDPIYITGLANLRREHLVLDFTQVDAMVERTPKWLRFLE